MLLTACLGYIDQRLGKREMKFDGYFDGFQRDFVI